MGYDFILTFYLNPLVEKSITFIYNKLYCKANKIKKKIRKCKYAKNETLQENLRLKQDYIEGLKKLSISQFYEQDDFLD